MAHNFNNLLCNNNNNFPVIFSTAFQVVKHFLLYFIMNNHLHEYSLAQRKINLQMIRLYDGRKCQSMSCIFFILRFNLLLYESHFSCFGVLMCIMMKQRYGQGKIFYFHATFDLLLYDSHLSYSGV